RDRAVARQDDLEGGPLLRRRAHVREVTAEAADHLARVAQTDAGAARAARAAFEQRVDDLRVDAGPLILDPHPDPLLVRVEPRAYGRARGREGERVEQQVGDHVPEGRRAERLGAVARVLYRDRDP